MLGEIRKSYRLQSVQKTNDEWLVFLSLLGHFGFQTTDCSRNNTGNDLLETTDCSPKGFILFDKLQIAVDNNYIDRLHVASM